MFQNDLDRRQSGDWGFTLIELLVTMVIIGLLAAIAIPTFLGHRAMAQETAIVNDLRNGATRAEIFAVDHDGMYDDGTVEFDIATAPGFQKSSPVTSLTSDAILTTAERFCIEGTIIAGATWSYDSARAIQLAQGPCA